MSEGVKLTELKGLKRAWREFVCRRLGHDFDCQEAKRFCRCCGREEWLFEKPFPLIGEAKYSWRHMDFGLRFVAAGRAALNPESGT